MKLQKTFKSCSADFRDNILEVSTGRIKRQWIWTDTGFASSALFDLENGNDWGTENPPVASWRLPGWEGRESKGKLLSLTAEVADDEGFTSQHLALTAEVEYPEVNLQLRFTVWAYPDARGLRTALAIRAMEGYSAEAARASGRTDCIPTELAGSNRRLLGYYNDTQNRNDTHLDLLQENQITGWKHPREYHRWPSAVCVERPHKGFALVQESHKCVNQKGHDTGIFRLSDNVGVEVLGWGILPQEVRQDRWLPAWAVWTLVYGNTPTEREETFKQFDHLRYPVDPQRDIYTQANTWGSTTPGPSAKEAAREENVLVEIDSQADLGIDIQQVDDGWQGDQYKDFTPDPIRYPEGWKNIVARAAEKGVKLGLWAPGQPVTLEQLKDNYKQANFLQYKLDFIHFKNRMQIQEVEEKIRNFILYTGQRVRVNWDVTENEPRFGYFFGREYGCIYLENRKDLSPEWVVYKPHTVLRDIWQLSRYLNVNRFQASIQNIDRVDPNHSDAALHSHAYCLAITLMATPLFFQETRHYSDSARDEIRSLLAVYKTHREAIYSGIVHPIGNRPDNESWTGFQCVLPDQREGYLTLFREIGNSDASASLSLRHVVGRTIQFTNLCNEDQWEAKADGNGEVCFDISTAPDFRFLHYRLR